MRAPIGHKRWAIAEGYTPSWSTGPTPTMMSHETLCMLNTTDCDTHVELTIFYATCPPTGPYRLTISACRTKHVRMNDLTNPEPIPPAVEYASVTESNVPIVVQHTRLDFRQAENALISTIAYACDE